ncbi:MAG: hypothetical protein AVDCRST_MAG14-2220 [uncultured Rubrobacteraceae bacterium]|uniref:Uncharacterized protein n=1 Tax=uncultured Rubrobacteraceae bacterium TaxID=349277 RepID=A0A6J4QZH4_9ACTN|nr:MAG: hypothetical protein AVDCRST_MAG14-2220 [uncultured Rubrobacteraceae bacterium]
MAAHCTLFRAKHAANLTISYTIYLSFKVTDAGSLALATANAGYAIRWFLLQKSIICSLSSGRDGGCSYLPRLSRGAAGAYEGAVNRRRVRL